MSLILMIRENQTLMVTQLWRERYPDYVLKQ